MHISCQLREDAFLVNHPNPTLQDSGTLVKVGISTFSIWTSILERVGSLVILRCSQWFAGDSLIKILAESRWKRGDTQSESLSWKEVNFCMTCHGRWKWTLLCKISTCLHHTTYLSLFIAESNKQTHISSRSTSACVAILLQSSQLPNKRKLLLLLHLLYKKQQLLFHRLSTKLPPFAFVPAT